MLVRDEIEICNYNSQQFCYDAALGAGGYCRENARKAGVKGDGIGVLSVPMGATAAFLVRRHV